ALSTLLPDGDEIGVRAGEDAAISQVRAGSISSGKNDRTQKGASAASGGEPGLRPLPQRQPGDVRASGLHRRMGVESGARPLYPGGRVSRTSLYDLRRAADLSSGGDAGSIKIRPRGHVRDDHALRHTGDRGGVHTKTGREVRGSTQHEVEEAARRS